jgi:hypothetical protein
MDEVGDGLNFLMWLGVLCALALADAALLAALAVRVAGMAGGGG